MPRTPAVHVALLAAFAIAPAGAAASTPAIPQLDATAPVGATVSPAVEKVGDLTGVPAAAAASSPMARQINKARRRRGLAPLRESASLSRSSARFARHLMRANRFGHAYRILASRRYSPLGEILARQSSWRLRRSAAMRGWLHSPTHRAILLSRRFNSVGVGRSRGRFGASPATIWVVHFGRR